MSTLFAPFSLARDLDVASRSRVLTPTRPAPAAPMDAVRDDAAVTLYVDLPGVDPDSIDLSVDRRVLTLSAERSWAPAEGTSVVMRERSTGSVRRQVRLSEGLDPAGVEARYDNGVLVVRVPVAESAQPRRVQVTTGSADADAPAIDAASSESDAD